MPKKRHANSLHIRIGDGLRHRLSLACVLGNEPSISYFARRAIEEKVEAVLKAVPSLHLMMRPDQPIYSMATDGRSQEFTLLSRTQGGERCWVLSAVGHLPSHFGGGYAYLADLTVVGTNPGADFRGIVVPSEGIIGDTERHP